MIYGRYRTLISIVIVLALAIAFVWGSVRVLDSVTGSAAPAPATPTAVVLVEQPSATPIPRATATPRHPLATATPAPTATPVGPPKVFVSATELDQTPTATFPTGITRIWCHVRNSALPKGAVTVHFVYNWFVGGAKQQMFPWTEGPSGGQTTDSFWSPSSNPGKYSCDVDIDGQPFGSARFALAP